MKMTQIVNFLPTLLSFFLLIHANKKCIKDSRRLNYYKLKACYKSTQAVIFWKNVLDVSSCMQVARDRNGMAFNYIPDEALSYATKFLANCQVLGCAEISNNSATLVPDIATDYYSAYAYGNYNSTVNRACINTVGFFGLTANKQNYTESILACQSMGGDLADVSSEQRTNLLSQLIRDNVAEWYKAAYVGLDDVEVEGVFKNSDGDLLSCTRFRAWAPGQPRSKHKNEDCVLLDAERTWRVVKCKSKLYGLCEFYPERPVKIENSIRNVTCNHISKKDKKKKRICLRKQKLFEIYHNSSRIDQCALLGDVLLKPSSN